MIMHELRKHKTGGDLNDQITVYAVDDPDRRYGGGACHRYEVRCHTGKGAILHMIRFQKGPVQEHGVNGLSDESLLAILIDRLEHFQAGPFACEQNERALTHLQAALEDLQARTKDCVERGVEGRSEA